MWKNSVTVSRYTPETFSHPLQSREKRGLNRRARHAIASQKTRWISVPPFPAPSWNNPRERDTRQAAVTHACARQGDMRLTYDKFNTLLPAFLPCWHLWPRATPGYYYCHSFSRISVCLLVCPFVRPSVHPSIRFASPFRVCLLCLAMHLLPHRGNLFSDAFEGSPWSKPLLPLSHIRETELLVFCARHVTESPRGRLCCRDVAPSCAASCGILVNELCEGGKWNTYIVIMRDDVRRISLPLCSTLRSASRCIEKLVV